MVCALIRALFACVYIHGPTLVSRTRLPFCFTSTKDVSLGGVARMKWQSGYTRLPIVPMLEMTLSSRCSHQDGSVGTKVCDTQLFCDACSNTLQQVATACSYNMFTASCARTFSFLFTSVDYLSRNGLFT